MELGNPPKTVHAATCSSKDHQDKQPCLRILGLDTLHPTHSYTTGGCVDSWVSHGAFEGQSNVESPRKRDTGLQ